MIDALNKSFSNDEISFGSGGGGLPKAVISNAHATAEVYLHGGHVTGFQPQGEAPVLWLSDLAVFNPPKAIRGGVPICWPWFGAHPTDPNKAAHGFARNRDWSVRQTATAEDGSSSLVLGMSDDEETRDIWPHAFDLEFTITIGSELRMALRTRNTGPGPMKVSGALHCYFSISAIDQITISGLNGCQYHDALDGMELKRQSGEVHIGEEVDRIYVDTSAPCVIDDRGNQRQIRISKDGSQSTVVWNPWIAKAARMADFPDEGYKSMICIETTNAAADLRILAPGEEHTLTQIVSIN